MEINKSIVNLSEIFKKTNDNKIIIDIENIYEDEMLFFVNTLSFLQIKFELLMTTKKPGEETTYTVRTIEELNGEEILKFIKRILGYASNK